MDKQPWGVRVGKIFYLHVINTDGIRKTVLEIDFWFQKNGAYIYIYIHQNTCCLWVMISSFCSWSLYLVLLSFSYRSITCIRSSIIEVREVSLYVTGAARKQEERHAYRTCKQISSFCRICMYLSSHWLMLSTHWASSLITRVPGPCSSCYRKLSVTTGACGPKTDNTDHVSGVTHYMKSHGEERDRDRPTHRATQTPSSPHIIPAGASPQPESPT